MKKNYSQLHQSEQKLLCEAVRLSLRNSGKIKTWERIHSILFQLNPLTQIKGRKICFCNASEVLAHVFSFTRKT